MAFVHECWEQALDLNSGQPYWFNRATGASQWHAPPACPAPAGSGAQQAQRLTEERSTPAPPAGSAGEAGEAQPPGLDQQQRRQRCWDSQWQQQWEPGLYYRDAAGLLQGPFTTEQLQGWRGLLPMDLPVLRLTAGSSGGGGRHAAVSGAAAAGGPPDSGGQPERGKGGQVAEGQAAVAQARQGVRGDDVWPPGAAGPGHGSGQQHTPSEEQHQLGDKQRQDAAGKVLQASGQRQLDGAALKEHNDEQQPEETAAQQQGLEPRPGAAEQGVDGVHWEELLLAELLGDGELLDRWRLEYPDQAAWPCAAPPAAVYAADRALGTAHSLAEAVLSGLPAHDEAVALARAAAAAGKSIQEVAAWGREADYSATAYRVAARGRIQTGGTADSLYAEAASWANPAELEQQLARAAERRKRGLRGEELRAVKQRKAELKEKKRREWLLN